MAALSKETICSLQEIIEQETGQKLTFEATEQMANNLVATFDLLGRLYHEIKHENNDDKRNDSS